MIGNIAAGLYGTGAPPVVPNSYESIATVTVGSGGSSSLTFNSIPSTYKHLQLRSIYQLTGDDNLRLQLNGSVNSNYYHYLYGSGVSAVAGSTNGNLFTIQWGQKTSTFYGLITDILDYTSTSKNKTIRTFGGIDFNGVSNYGGLYVSSNLYATTDAITSLTINSPTYPFIQYSTFALYGLKDS